jgi:hypothetical protein
MQALCGARDIALLRHRHEVTQMSFIQYLRDMARY